ncbi:helix-turn-helix domain-containing protein [Demequina sp.]|uniref:helix-turn-helix domain-containing protein n=1 Tax=Demequina sp. TaxID=2050685 RepID=UPI003D0F6E9F
MNALTQRARPDVLRLVAQAGASGLTANDLADRLDATRAWALRVLTELEAVGFVTGTPPKGERQAGTATRFVLRADRVDAAVNELRDWVQGR